MSYPILAPNSTWFTQGGTTVKRASITQIDIKDSYTPTGTVTSSWDASAAKDGSIMCYVEGTKLTIAGNGSGKVMANTDSSNVFKGFTKMATFNGSNVLNTSNVTTLERAFYDCMELTSLDLSSWNTSKVESLRSTFNGMLALESLNVKDWDTSNVTTMQATFQCGVTLTELDLSGWTTDKVTSMKAMFGGVPDYGGDMKLTKIIGIDDWNVSKVETMEDMFHDCSSLENLNVTNWNVGAVTTMHGMFYYCSSLENLNVTNWNVSAVTDMRNMFTSCSSLQNLDVSNWNTANCTDMGFMFWGASSIGTLDVSNWNVSKVTNFDHMFAHSRAVLRGVENWTPSTACTNMNAMFHTIGNKTIDVSKFNTSNVQFMSQMFEYSSLEHIKGLENFNTSNVLGFEEMFGDCTKLKKLNLSSFDTRKAKDGVTGSANGHITATMKDMFRNCTALEKITLGPNFTFKGDGTTTSTANYAVLPTTPDGNWYTRFREPVATIPDYANETYYISLDIVNNLKYFIKNGTIMDITDAIREKTNITNTIEGVELANKILSIETKSDILRAENISF